MAKKESENNILSEEEIEKEKIKQQLEQYQKILIERVDMLRKSKQMSWRDFSKKVKVPQSTVDSWNIRQKDKSDKEKIDNGPRLSNILNIANYFNVSIDWLFGLSPNREPSPVLMTYKEWIDVIENYLEYGAVEPFYRPGLDDSSQAHDEDTQEEMESAQNELESFVKKFMSSGPGFQISEEFRKADPPPTREIPMEDNFQPQYDYTPDSDNIYDVSKDMNGVYPDILEIKDTFLRCLISCLYYNKVNESEENYKAFREKIIKRYGSKKVLNFDIYELRAVSYLKRTEKEKKLFKKYNEVSEIIFAKYDSIGEINTKELDIIWKELIDWKEKFDKGEIKTVTQLE